MSITHCIIHSLNRASEKQKTLLNLRDNEIVPEGPIVSLFTQLKQSFQRSSQRQYGLFDPEQSDNALPAWLKQYQSESMGFTSVSSKITQQLALILDEGTEIFNAHLLFVVEELLEESCLYIFWINHVETQFINNELNVDSIEYIDSTKLQYVLKLDFNQWSIDGWQQYLSMILSRGNPELSHAFSKCCGFVSSVNLQQQTDEFLSIVDEYAQQIPPAETSEYKNKIVDYCVEQDMQGNPINFNNLSQELNSQQPEHFSDFVKNKQENPKQQIYTHRSSLKKFVRFYGREKDLSISFSSTMMGENVIYDPENNELTLKSIPKTLKQQLLKYIKQSD